MATPLALVWDLIARDNASATFRRVGDSAESTATKTEAASKKIGLFGLAVGAVGVAVAVHAAKMAGDFQYQMNRMTTAAGESQKNLKLISDGVLRLMSATGTSAKELQSGLYLIESAGYHGAAGLKVLEAAAKGAKIENADLATVANAVTSAMVDYHLSADQSAQVMNTLIAAVAHGKTTLADLSTAFSNVGAAGASAHVPMADLAAAIATMTMHGTDAAKAGTYLRQVIGQLEAPSAKARSVMQSLGLDANKVGQTLSSGPGGLAGAIQMLEDAIQNHLTPAGLVALEVFKKSKDPVTAYQKVLANLPPSLVTTFGALSEMTGGVRSLQGFLQLGGENLATFRKNTLAVNEAVKAGGKGIEGWASTQKTFNVQMDMFKQSINALLIRLGTALLPTFTHLATGANGFFQALSGNVARMDQSDRPKLELFGLGLRAMFQAISGQGVTSNGFVGAMEHIGVAIRSLYEAFKSLVDAVLPLAKQAWPLLLDAFKATLAIVTRLGQALSSLGGFLREHKTLVQSLAVGISVLAGAMIAYNLAVRVVGRGLFIWAEAQKAVNAAMAFGAENPIFLTIAAIAALAAGLVYAYQHSARFRDIVHDVLNALKVAARDVVGAFKVTVDAVAHAFGNVEHAYSNVAHAVSNTLHALDVAWRDTWGAVKAAWDAVYPVFKVIGEIFYAVIGGTILASIDAFKLAWTILWGYVKLQWDTVGHPVVTFIGDSIEFMWNNIAKPAFAALQLAWHVLWAFFKLQWDYIAKPIFDGFTASIQFMWNDLARPIFALLHDGWDALWKVYQTTWNTIGKPIFDGIKTAVNGLWNDVLHPVFNTIGKAWDDLWGAFPKVVGDVWDTVVTGAVGGINVIIDVLNGFIGAIDWILDKLPGHLHIDKIGHISSGQHHTSPSSQSGGGQGGIKAIANGGVLDGYSPGVDSVRALLSPGEGILVPEAVRGLGADFVYAANSYFGGSRIRGTNKPGHFGLGGILGGIGSFIHSVAMAPLRAALDIAEKPVKAAMNLLPAGVVRGLGKGMFGSVDHAIRKMLYDDGGLLMPGVTLAVNNTGRPERVLTNGQADKLGRGLHVDQLTVQYLGDPPILAQTVVDVNRSLTYTLGRF